MNARGLQSLRERMITCNKCKLVFDRKDGKTYFTLGFLCEECYDDEKYSLLTIANKFKRTHEEDRYDKL